MCGCLCACVCVANIRRVVVCKVMCKKKDLAPNLTCVTRFQCLKTEPHVKRCWRIFGCDAILRPVMVCSRQAAVVVPYVCDSTPQHDDNRVIRGRHSRARSRRYFAIYLFCMLPDVCVSLGCYLYDVCKCVCACVRLYVCLCDYVCVADRSGVRSVRCSVVRGSD